MPKFLFKSLLFCFLTIGFCFLLQRIIAPKIRDENAFVGATIDKEKRLSNLKSPRLIFIGGSNLAFGLNSKTIADSLKLNVVNMGLHAGLGVAFVLNQAKQYIKKGDKIVLSVEYGLTNLGDKKLFTQLIDINPNSANYLGNSFNDKLRLIDINWQRCVSSLFFAAIVNPNEKVYKRNVFSEEGDVLAHLDQPQATHLMNMGKMVFRDYSEEITILNAFIADATQKGAEVFYTFPAYIESEYKLNNLVLNQYENQFKNQLKCPIINTPETFVFPNEDFFDTAYHLNKNGRKKRTELMIKILKNTNFKNYTEGS
jgi:hypothetical protein